MDAGSGPDRPDPAVYAAAVDLLHHHLEHEVAPEPWVQAVEHDPSIPRWYVRFGSEVRDAATIYFDLHQRSLHYEVYFLPSPEPPRPALWELALRANHDRYGARFSLGPDGDLYLTGRVLLEHLDRVELDRIVGSCYEAVERWFPAAVRVAYGRRVGPDAPPVDD